MCTQVWSPQPPGHWLPGPGTTVSHPAQGQCTVQCTVHCTHQHPAPSCAVYTRPACLSSSQLCFTLVGIRVSLARLVMVFDSSGTSEGGPGGSGRAQAVWMDALMAGPLRSLPPSQPPPHPQPAPPARYHQPTYTSPWLRVS